MAILVCYYKEEISIDRILNALATIFNTSKNRINELKNFDESATINFEITQLSDSCNFNFQLEVFLLKENILSAEIYNNLLLVIELKKIIGLDFLINDESDNPYSWLLLKDHKLFLVEQDSDFDDGIDINTNNQMELDIKKVLNILPQKKDILNNSFEVPYFVKDSNSWIKCSI